MYVAAPPPPVDGVYLAVPFSEKVLRKFRSDVVTSSQAAETLGTRLSGGLGGGAAGGDLVCSVFLQDRGVAGELRLESEARARRDRSPRKHHGCVRMNRRGSGPPLTSACHHDVGAAGKSRASSGRIPLCTPESPGDTISCFLRRSRSGILADSAMPNVGTGLVP